MKLRLNPEELEIFKRKASRYHSLSAMVRDSVAQFDDVATKGKIESLVEMQDMLRKYQHSLAWMGGNLNQMMHQANQLAIAGELTQTYLKEQVMPAAISCRRFIIELKNEQNKIYHKLMSV